MTAQTDAPPRPGRCPIPEPYKPYPQWTPEEKSAYAAWQEASLDYWIHVAGLFAARFPSRHGLAFEQPGHVIYADYEDRSWAWLGATDGANGDGPWAHGDPLWVGGYRYEADSCGEVYTECVLVGVADPDDVEQVVEALVQAARELGTLEFTETV